MIEVADIFRQHAASYQARHVLLPNQLRALRDITYCRTAYFGGHLAQCDHCAHLHYSYHSCRNRHCPKCHGEQTRDWLERQESRLLPCSYFLLTFTLPAGLRKLAWQHQKVVYGALLRAAASTVLTLTADPKWLGATPDIMAVLHTWTRAMLYHPHAHLLVSAGGYCKPDRAWVGLKHPAFLVPVQALSRIFRAKMRQALVGAQLLSHASPEIWDQSWVVHARPAGTGTKVLEYLPVTSFASPSPTVAWRHSRRATSPFAIGKTARNNSVESPCPPTSSSGASCCTSCHRASPKYVTTDWAVLRLVSIVNVPATSWLSFAHHRLLRIPRHFPPSPTFPLPLRPIPFVPAADKVA